MICACIFSCGNNSSISGQGKGVMHFDKKLFDYGIIPLNGDGSHKFIFTNTGTEPVIIKKVARTCGCTSVGWTIDPIKPGKTGYILVTYNTRTAGIFRKHLTVYSNSNIPVLNLYLKGVVDGGLNFGLDTSSRLSQSVVVRKSF